MSRFGFRTIMAAAVAMLAWQAPAQAVTYNLTFTNTVPSLVVNGTGTIDIDTPLGSGNEFFTVANGGLNSLSFLFTNSVTLGTTAFTLASDLGGTAQVFIQNGNFAGFIFQATSAGFDFLSTGALSFIISGPVGPGIGTIAASLAPPEATGETPLPGAVFLFGSVLAGAAGIRKWRKRAAAPVAA